LPEGKDALDEAWETLRLFEEYGKQRHHLIDTEKEEVFLVCGEMVTEDTGVRLLSTSVLEGKDAPDEVVAV
jgi:hypothetical protein